MKKHLVQPQFQASPRSIRIRRPSKVDLFDLACLRVAQIHQCQLGQDHFQSKLRQMGGISSRLDQLHTWPVCKLFTSRERSALALVELLARRKPNESKLLSLVLHEIQEHLTRPEIVELVIAIEAMREWKQWGALFMAKSTGKRFSKYENEKEKMVRDSDEKKRRDGSEKERLQTIKCEEDR